MSLKEVIDIPCGLRYMLSALELASGASRRVLLEMQMMTSAERIRREYADLDEFRSRLTAGSAHARQIALKLTALRDLRNTFERLAGGQVLDDVELFELKRFVLMCSQLEALLREAGIGCVEIPDTEPVLRLLDPDGMRIASFHVYDSYDDELRALRRRISVCPDQADALTARCLAIEDEVRRRLSAQLGTHLPALKAAFAAAVRTDILSAKAMQMQTMRLVVPVVTEKRGAFYREVFNPEVKESVEKAGGTYQPIDIWFDGRPTCIVGANMGGKTVILKTLALCQLLCQFGFCIPASQAETGIADRVCFSGGDFRVQAAGLSSFAAEVKDIDRIIDRARAGERVLALIDEPARTTNPAEGRALVEGLVDTLADTETCLVLTTHYNLRDEVGRRLKVKGFTDTGMDYSVSEVAAGGVPHEALRVAEKLGADAVWIRNAQKYLKETKTNDTQ